MEIKKYNSEKHSEYLPDYQVDGYKEGDIDKFKSVAREALQELKETVDFSDQDIELVIALTETENMADDSPESYYFMGFSFDDGMRGHQGNAVFMRVTDVTENWKAAVKDMLIHELGHQIFYQEDVGWEDDQYHSIMFEGYAENLAKIVAEENSRDYSPIWRKDEPVELDKEMLYEDLEHSRTFGDEEDEITHNMFIQGGDRWSNAEGYTIAYKIVRHLIEQNKVSIQSMLKNSSDEWKEYVDSAVEELY